MYFHMFPFVSSTLYGRYSGVFVANRSCAFRATIDTFHGEKLLQNEMKRAAMIAVNNILIKENER